MFPNFHSSPSTTTSTLVHEISPFQMGTFFLPQPFYNQDPHNNTTPQPNNEVTPPYFPNSYSNVLYQPIYNQEVDPSSSPKRDRHTKISTAQGVRDRRVRLSMGIAREFFDLQDMLGFDRASKTLGWLLANSKEAIQELALEKKGSFSPATNDDAIGSSSSGSLMRRKKRRKSSGCAREKCCCKSGSCEISQVSCNKSFVVRENREKARARARERTREKLSTTTAEPVRFDLHHHGFQANGSSNCSSTFLVDSKADQGLNQSKLVDRGTKSSNELTNLISSAGYSQNHPIAPRGDQGWNFYNFPNW